MAHHRGRVRIQCAWLLPILGPWYVPQSTNILKSKSCWNSGNNGFSKFSYVDTTHKSFISNLKHRMIILTARISLSLYRLVPPWPSNIPLVTLPYLNPKWIPALGILAILRSETGVEGRERERRMITFEALCLPSALPTSTLLSPWLPAKNSSHGWAIKRPY